jgi:hypoxanthine phosphoribosyltransferase
MGYAFVSTLKKALKIREENEENEHTLSGILKTALRECSKGRLSDELLDITQLYLTKLIEPDKVGIYDSDDTASEFRKPTENGTENERATLEKLLSTDERVVTAFRLDRPLYFNPIRKTLRDVSRELKSKSSCAKPHDRYLETTLGKDAGHYLDVFYESAREKLGKVNIDVIIYVAHGALEPALLLKELKPDAELLPVRYSHYRAGDSEPKLPRYMTLDEFGGKIKGKSVIVIDDDIDSGRTIAKVVDWVNDFGPKRLYFGAPLAKRLKYYQQDYNTKEIARWSTEIFSREDEDTADVGRWPSIFKFRVEARKRRYST